jgi:hypothetical protein
MISTQETTLPEHASGVGCHRGDSRLCQAALYTAPSTLSHDRAVLPSRSSDGLELSSWLPSSRAEFEASAYGRAMSQLAELMGTPSESECLIGSRDVLGFCEPESDASVYAREPYSFYEPCEPLYSTSTGELFPGERVHFELPFDAGTVGVSIDVDDEATTQNLESESQARHHARATLDLLQSGSSHPRSLRRSLPVQSAIYSGSGPIGAGERRTFNL